VPATIFIVTGKISSKEPLWGAKVACYINSTTASEINLDSIGKYILDSDNRKLKAIDDIIERLKLINEIKRDIVINQLAKQLKVEKVDKAADVLFLSWDEIRDMSTNSISFGAHTVSHPNLALISAEQVKREVVESKHRIEVETHGLVNCFAYPYGGLRQFNERIKTVLREAGFNCACSTIYGRQSPNDDLYQLRRIPIFHYHNMNVFKAKLCGLFDCVDRLEKFFLKNKQGHAY
jgi:peptidoglycan/xylan/chitin deacetylase (PgdA/CDA1 family)